MLWELLIAFQLKHFLCDYPLQFGIMLNKFKKTGWVKGLSIHAGIHALATAIILGQFTRMNFFIVLGLAALDFVAHFGMDRVKASPAMLGRFKAISDAATFAKAGKVDRRSNTLFWWSLGLDQMVHHLTHYAIIAIALVANG